MSPVFPIIFDELRARLTAGARSVHAGGVIEQQRAIPGRAASPRGGRTRAAFGMTPCFMKPVALAADWQTPCGGFRPPHTVNRHL